MENGEITFQVTVKQAARIGNDGIIQIEN